MSDRLHRSTITTNRQTMDSDASARTPVADEETVSGFQIGIVLIGISITLPLLYSAGELVRGTGLSKGIASALLGALILSIMSVPAAIVGARTRLSSYMIIEHTFGYVGAKFVNFWFGIFLLGWYAVTAELFGRTLYLASLELTNWVIAEPVYTIVSSILVIITTVYGFKAIDRLALVAVPFLLLALIAVVVISLQHTSFGDLLQVEAQSMDMATAISAVVGAAVVGVVLTPDLTRYTRTVRDCVVASFVGQGGGMTAAYVLGMIPVLVWNELEPMNYMFIIGYGGLALGVLVFATWTTNTVNLYSTALAARASIPFGNYRSVTVISGIVGTFAALIGIADNLIDFLVVLGLLVPPIAGVYLCNFFLLGRTDFSPAR
ncbi:MAG: cytosine permease, partial [Woeseiaceae bacterium]|nr:cytosine permease [Woeseiaceae bacterium]